MEHVRSLISDTEIRLRIESLAETISQQCPSQLSVVSLLKGSFVFVADLVRALHRQGVTLEIDFLGLSSYGAGTQSSGAVRVTQDLQEDVSGRHVLLVDDILESGRTLAFAHELLTGRGAEAITTLVLLEKPGKRAVAFEADLVGFAIPDTFVVGYGLDYANRYRELPFIGVLDAQIDA